MRGREQEGLKDDYSSSKPPLSMREGAKCVVVSVVNMYISPCLSKKMGQILNSHRNTSCLKKTPDHGLHDTPPVSTKQHTVHRDAYMTSCVCYGNKFSIQSFKGIGPG